MLSNKTVSFHSRLAVETPATGCQVRLRGLVPSLHRQVSFRLPTTLVAGRNTYLILPGR